MEKGMERIMDKKTVGIIHTTPATIASLTALAGEVLGSSVKVVNILDDSILPDMMAEHEVEFVRRERLTASSGALVPKATIVRPMIMLGTLRSFAREELPSTKKSAPLINNRKPVTSHIYSMLIFSLLDCLSHII